MTLIRIAPQTQQPPAHAPLGRATRHAPFGGGLALRLLGCLSLLQQHAARLQETRDAPPCTARVPSAVEGVPPIFHPFE